MRYRSVLKGIEQCALAWVVEGETYRNLTEQEAIVARNKQAQLREPLAVADMRHIRVVPPPGAVWSSKMLALDANAFAAGYYHPSPA